MLKVTPEAFSLIPEFETGKLDLMDVPEAEFARWTESEKWQAYLHVVNEMNLFYLGLNCDEPPFDDVRVRRAMSYGQDTENFLYPLFHSSQAERRNRYSNPEVDRLIEKNRVICRSARTHQAGTAGRTIFLVEDLSRTHKWACPSKGRFP